MLYEERHFQISRMAFPLLLLALLHCFALLVDADYIPPLQKLDPVLKPIVLKREVMAAPGSVLPTVHWQEAGLINTIIKVSGNPMAVESTGARVRSVIGSIVTADVLLPSLDDLISLPNVIYVQAARQMQPAMLDVSVPDTRADQVWRSAAGYTGKGVIVGIIDGGIDWRHPDFEADDGTSRILYIWDQTVRTQGQSPKGYGYGVEWTKAQVDSGQCQEMDPTSHGTHIASTIAGNGRGRHEFTGMAPEADIIAVKTGFDDANIIDAADYIFRKAVELNRPAVINMSFGSHWGPHDGTDMLDQVIDELLDEPGRAVVASAGNDGGDAVHLGTSYLRGPVGENYPWAAIEPLVGARAIVLQIWHAPGSSLYVRFLLPENDKGDLGDPGIGWAPEERFRHFIVPDGPLARAEVVIDRYPASQFLYPNFDGIYMHISDNGDPTIPIDEYIYAVEFDGPGVGLDAYVMWRARFTTKLPGSISFPSSSYLLAGDGSKTIISPSSADSVICVGSYVSKSEWVDSENRIRTQNLITNSISVFSSLGPLLDGGLKPDIAAPGEMIVAAFSADSWDRPRSVYRDGEHVSWRGTSMSSPHVAGAVALMYQQDPDLTASEVKHRLNSTAVDRGPAGWDRAWGHGKLDVMAAMGIPSAPDGLRATADDSSIALTWYRNSESDIAGYNIYIRSENGEQNISAGKVTSYQLTHLPNGAPVSVSVNAYDTDGNEGPKSPEITVTPNPVAPDVTPPKPPDDLVAIPLDGAVDLTWLRNSEHDLSGYRVYYGTSSSNYSNTIWAGKSTDYRIKNLTNGVRIYVAVSSVDISGNESGKSREVYAVPQLFSRSTLRYQSGWPVSMKHDVYSSPALYDVDGDGRLEVAISSKDGEVSLLNCDGQDMAGWPVSTGSASVSSPALGDVDNDGRVEVVVGSGDMVHMWRYNGLPVQGWPVKTDGSVVASPALGDIDGDGLMEVVIGSRDGKIYAYKGAGSLVGGWPVMAGYGYINSSAALGDIDGDGSLEIVVGSEGGDLYVFNGDGTMAENWPVYVGSAIDSSPALGDIDGDGGIEIIAADERGRVYAWHYDSDPVKGWPVDLREDIASSPALGDVDGDGSSLETVINTSYGTIYVLRSDGTTMDGWPVSVMDIATSSPALGDINGDGSVEIIVATGTGLHYIGLVYAFRNTGKALGTMWPVYTEGNICDSSPALGDLDGDGDVELVVGSCRLPDGSGGSMHAWDLTGRVAERSIVWGGFRHDAHHSGLADDTLPPSFVIATLQNAVLREHLSLYVIASEELIAPPDLVVEVILNEEEEHAAVQSISVVQIDAHIYQADFALEWDGQYTFTASGMDVNGNRGSSSRTVSIRASQEEFMAPAGLSLLPNYPNPFNPGTWIPYQLSQPADVTIGIYGAAGQLIRSLHLGHCPVGSYISRDDAAYWDGMDDSGQEAASGLYFCVLRAGGARAVSKMVLLR